MTKRAAWLIAVMGSMIGCVHSTPVRPAIVKLGTIDCDMVETTPIVFHGRLYRVEYVRERYTHKEPGETGSYFRLVDVANGTATDPFARGYHLCSALVHGDSVYVFGVDKWGGNQIMCFRSGDLSKWESQSAIQLPGWSLFNNSVCEGDGRYIMAIEVGGPPEVVGHPFTIRFAQSRDLKTWNLLPEPAVFSKDRYTSCPTMRFCDGQYYMFYCEELRGPQYPTYLVRSPDLVHWEASPFNPVMKLSEEDRLIAKPQRFTEAERERIAMSKNVCNSDLDLCEFEGEVYLYYCWGNQTGIEHLAEARFRRTLRELLQGYYP